MENLPKNILKVKDLTFILPDDFNGDLEDALIAFITYRKSHVHTAEYTVDPVSLEILFTTADARVSGEYGIFTLEDGKYIMINGSRPGKE